MNKFKSHFKFTRQEQSGIFYLLLLIFISLGATYGIKMLLNERDDRFVADQLTQVKIEALKQRKDSVPKESLYPFNPNYMTDFKGYALGMSVVEIDRLLQYRAQDKYVNSVVEFQLVTQVSKVKLNRISPFLRFPEFKDRNKEFPQGKNLLPEKKEADPTFRPKDINAASSDDLRAIYGIGEVLSTRIIKFRDRLGGYLVEDQLYDVYGLKPEVAARVLKRFKILKVPKINKININTASIQEISSLVYLNYNLAKRIVEYRENNGTINSINELSKIAEFPIDKIDRIQLYLTL